MSTARNIIVGDSKQLPNIVTQNQLKSEPIFRESKLSDVYSPKLSLLILLLAAYATSTATIIKGALSMSSENH